MSSHLCQGGPPCWVGTVVSGIWCLNTPTTILLCVASWGWGRSWPLGEESGPDVPVGQVCNGKVSGAHDVLLDGWGRLCMDVVGSSVGDLSMLPGQKKENVLSSILWPLHSLLTFRNHFTDPSLVGWVVFHIPVTKLLWVGSRMISLYQAFLSIANVL